MVKKILALVLTFGLLATALAIPAAAADAKPQTTKKAAYVNPNHCTKAKPCKYSPSIILPGIAQSETVYYENGKPTELKGGIVFPDTREMKLAPVIFALLGSLLLQHDVGLTKSIYKLVCQLFEPQRVDNTGKHVHDLRTNIIGRVADMEAEERRVALEVNVPLDEVLETVGDDHVYFFAFNLVGEVWDNIDELEKYIDFVRKETGHSKVNLINVSLGGTLFTGYIERYGHKKLDQVINVVSASDGTDLLADLFGHKFNRDENFLYRDWFPMIFSKDANIADGWDTSIGYLVDLVMRMMPNKLFESIISTAWLGVFDTIMRNCTQFWAMVPCDRYDELAKMYLSDDAHKVLRAKTDSYHTAQLNLAKNVKKAVAAGVHINSIAGSGLAFGDVEYTFFAGTASRNKVNSDGIIGVKNASMGAKGAAPGKKLPADYKPKKAGYISPDRTVDCSTAVLPDNTWIFLGQHHEVGRNDAVLHLATKLLLTPGMDVHTDPKNYPQFNYAMNTNELRRWRLKDAEALLKEGKLNAAQKKELQAAIQEGYAVRALTVGDAKRCEAATNAVNNILRKHGKLSPVYEQTWFQKQVESALGWITQQNIYFFGNNGYIEGGNPIRYFKKVFSK